MPSISVLINKIDQLPSIPAVVKKLVDLTADPDAEINDILELMERDQSLTASVLRLCNSSYYGLSAEVSSVRDAVVMLGFNTVSNICVTLGPSLYFKRRVWVYGHTGSDLWRHSVASAVCAEQLAKRYHDDMTEVAYTAGLLHDLGKLVLAEYHEEDLKKVEEIVSRGTPLIEAEKTVLGIHHGAIGGKLTKRWKFPSDLVEAIKFHHTPDRARLDPELCNLTHMADLIARSLGEGLDARLDDPAGVLAAYHVTDDVAVDVALAAQVQIDEIEASFGQLLSTHT